MSQKKNSSAPELSVMLVGDAAIMQPDPKEIATAAYFAWERDGRPDGRDHQYWLEAEMQLAGKFQSAAAGQEKNGQPRRTPSKKTDRMA